MKELTTYNEITEGQATTIIPVSPSEVPKPSENA